MSERKISDSDYFGPLIGMSPDELQAFGDNLVAKLGPDEQEQWRKETETLLLEKKIGRMVNDAIERHLAELRSEQEFKEKAERRKDFRFVMEKATTGRPYRLKPGHRDANHF
jgi:hypothetical protein